MQEGLQPIVAGAERTYWPTDFPTASHADFKHSNESSAGKLRKHGYTIVPFATVGTEDHPPSLIGLGCRVGLNTVESRRI